MRTGRTASVRDAHTEAFYATIFITPAGCWPLNDSYKLASSVARNGTGSFSFTFNYASKLSNVANVSGPLAAFNKYPVNLFGGEAFGTDAALPEGSGLPYRIVATQVGQTP